MAVVAEVAVAIAVVVAAVAAAAAAAAVAGAITPAAEAAVRAERRKASFSTRATVSETPPEAERKRLFAMASPTEADE